MRVRRSRRGRGERRRRSKGGGAGGGEEEKEEEGKRRGGRAGGGGGRGEEERMNYIATLKSALRKHTASFSSSVNFFPNASPTALQYNINRQVTKMQAMKKS